MANEHINTELALGTKGIKGHAPWVHFNPASLVQKLKCEY